MPWNILLSATQHNGEDGTIFDEAAALPGYTCTKETYILYSDIQNVSTGECLDVILQCLGSINNKLDGVT